MGYIKKWSEEKIAAMEREGRGVGFGSSYRPWIEVSEISSRGRSRRPWSPKTGRVHHLLSDVEHNIFLALEWSLEVSDIREQYPLDRALTQQIAREMNVRHPHYPGTDIPSVMTIDFLATIESSSSRGEVAISAKRTEEAEDARSIEKQEIERRYCELIKISHHLIFHTQIPQQPIKNIEWIRSALLKQGEIEPRPGFFDECCKRMAQEVTDARWSRNPLNEYCGFFDSRHDLLPGTGLRVARMLMYQRALNADLGLPELHSQPISSFLSTTQQGSLRIVGGH